MPILQREAGGQRDLRHASGSDRRNRDRLPTLRLLQDARADAVAILLPDARRRHRGVPGRGAQPLEGSFAGTTVLTTPPPSLGGRVVQAGLAALDVWPTSRPARRTTRARSPPRSPPGMGETRGTGRGGTPDRDDARLGRRRGRRRRRESRRRSAPGSGVFRHGFQLNNMLGELDVIGTEPRDAGTRLPSMMTPTLVLDDGGQHAARRRQRGLRAARGRDPAGRRRRDRARAARRRGDRAPAPPRRRRDGPRRRRLAGTGRCRRSRRTGFDVRSWSDRNLFFGGVSAVERRPDGSFGAAGDPRRGGHGVVIA